MTRIWLIIFGMTLMADVAFGDALSYLRHSVFKIHVQSRDPKFDAPWQKESAGGSTGTGFYIGDGRIMTNAHVVANATYIAVQRDGASEPEPAYVEFVGHDCDLAILGVKNEKFFKGVRSMPFGQIPSLRSPVATIGFPTGGEQISITEGIVSRVGYRRYVHHGAAKHLLIQVDSAINPGNSGGPVVQGRKVVGVAFQAYTRAENTGYIIPTPVVRRFLKDIEDGVYHGHPDDGLLTEEWTMMNPSNQQYHGLGKDDGGVKVVTVAKYVPTHGKIQAGDIILAINDRPIGIDGKITFNGERVDFRAVYDLALHGDIVMFRVMRDGKRRDVSVTVAESKPHHEQGEIFAKYPKFFVYGGLVFTTLSRSYLQTWGAQWYRKAPLLLRYLQYYSEFEPEATKMEEMIVYAKRLPHAVNRYADDQLNALVTKVDGVPVTSLKEFAKQLEKGDQDHAVIEFWGGQDPVIISRAMAKESHQAITGKYGVTPDRWFAGNEEDAAFRGGH